MEMALSIQTKKFMNNVLNVLISVLCVCAQSEGHYALHYTIYIHGNTYLKCVMVLFCVPLESSPLYTCKYTLT